MILLIDLQYIPIQFAQHFVFDEKYTLHSLLIAWLGQKNE